MQNIIDTERLSLRKFTKDDYQFILELLNSEGWVKYIGDRQIKTAQQAKEYIENRLMQSYKSYHFGCYLVALKATGEAIGLCGFIKRKYLLYPDIGFAFLPQYTQKGYAFEAAKATLAYGFEQLNLNEIFAIVLPENASSICLIEKMGLQFEKMVRIEQEDLMLFNIKNE